MKNDIETLFFLETGFKIRVRISRPGGTGPVGPAITGPTFEPGRIYIYFILKNSVNFLKKSKVYTK